MDLFYKEQILFVKIFPVLEVYLSFLMKWMFSNIMSFIDNISTERRMTLHKYDTFWQLFSMNIYDLWVHYVREKYSFKNKF